MMPRFNASSSPRKRGPSAFDARGERAKSLGSRSRGNDERWFRGSLIALCLLACMLAHAVDPLPFKDHAEELRFQALTKQLRCLVCQNESLADSNAPLAADLRRDVFEQIEAGKSDEEIKTWLTARYSDFVLYDPPLHAATLLLWFGPALVLLAGGAAIFMIVRRRSRATLANAPARSAVDTEDDW